MYCGTVSNKQDYDIHEVNYVYDKSRVNQDEGNYNVDMIGKWQEHL